MNPSKQKIISGKERHIAYIFFWGGGLVLLRTIMTIVVLFHEVPLMPETSFAIS